MKAAHSKYSAARYVQPLQTQQDATHPFTFELFLPGCLGSWEEAGSRGSAGWSASWLEAAPAGAGPDDGDAALAFNVFCRFETWWRSEERG